MNGRCKTSNGVNDVALTALEGKAALSVLEDTKKASNRIGVEEVHTKVGTIKLFGLTEARGVAVAVELLKSQRQKRQTTKFVQ